MFPIKSGKMKYKVSIIEVKLSQGESTLIWCTSSLVCRIRSVTRVRSLYCLLWCEMYDDLSAQ